VNMVMVGAASPFLPLAAGVLEGTICEMFASKDPDVIQANVAAFRFGRAAAEASKGEAAK